MKKEKHRQSNKKTLECPCCDKQRNIITETPLIEIQETFTHACLPARWVERSIEENWHAIQWACTDCIHEGRAIAGKPWLQTFCDWPPYLAYFDKTYICTYCHTEFTFSAQEQQYWYEELKFWVQSYPTQCLACRRKRRERNRSNQTLQNKLKELPERHLQEPQQLLEIASLYLKVGSYQKATEYLGRARNRARERGELTALADQIESLKQQIPEGK